MDPLSDDSIEGHLEDYSDSDEYSPKLNDKVPYEVTVTRNERVPLISNKSFSFHGGLCCGRGHVPGSFALLSLCNF